MKLEIVSGQPDVTLEDKFEEILRKNKVKTDNAMIYPEREIWHPKTLYDTIRQKVSEHIEAGEDLFILTYSEHVFNAVRVEIKNHNFKGAKCNQFLNSGEDVCSTITCNGRLMHWVDDIFTVLDSELLELL